MSAAIHLHRQTTLSGSRVTCCGLTWSYLAQGARGGTVQRLVYDCVEDPSAADCRRCLKYARAGKAKR